jgi:hypothetical protein
MVKEGYIECPNCGAENIKVFIMYYGDLCLECDFDIREYFRELKEDYDD